MTTMRNDYPKDLLTEKSQGSYPIRPVHVDSRKRFWEAFGSVEAEASAALVVAFCQEQGDWTPFTRGAMDDFYRRNGGTGSFRDNGLMYGGLLVDADDLVHVTHEFVCRCFRASPARPLDRFAEARAANPWLSIRDFTKRRGVYWMGVDLRGMASLTRGQGHTAATMELAQKIGALVVFSDRDTGAKVAESYTGVTTCGLREMGRLGTVRCPVLFDNSTWGVIGETLGTAVGLLDQANAALDWGWKEAPLPARPSPTVKPAEDVQPAEVVRSEEGAGPGQEKNHA